MSAELAPDAAGPAAAVDSASAAGVARGARAADGSAARLAGGSSKRRGGTGTSRGARALLGAVVPVLLLVLWWASTNLGWVPAHKLPTPQSVVSAAGDLAASGDLTKHIGISVQRVLLGFGIGGALGLAVGALVGLSRTASDLLAPLLGALRAVPSLAWVPLLITWLLIGETSKVTLIAIGAFFPVFTTVSQALRHVDPHLVEAARAFGLRGWRLLTTVQLPAVVPAIFSGLRLALAQSWLFLVAAELIASSMGLGFLLTDSQNNGRLDRLILAIILLAIIGKITDTLLGLVERWAERRWT